MPDALVEFQHLSHAFRPGRHIVIKALKDVSFSIQKGEIFGLVGESGCGKSTLARCLMNIYQPSSGRILYKGVDLCDGKARRQHRRMLQRERQLIFQDSASSLNPRMRVERIVTEPLIIQRIAPPRGSLRAEAEHQLRSVGLDASCLNKTPVELSGGQRQRVSIARALILEPELIVADEPIASLDVSIQAQIVTLFKHLQLAHGFTFLFIAHDLSMVRYLCDRTGVMRGGRLVELAPTRELFSNPLHPYTQALLSAIPFPDPLRERARPAFSAPPPEPAREGALVEVTPDHFVLQSPSCT